MRFMRVPLGWFLLIVGFAVVGLFGAYLSYEALQQEIARERTARVLARNIYWEANDEPVLSQALVAQTTRNRVAKNRTYWGGNTIEGVVFARRTLRDGTIVCQFSWTCDPAKQNAQPPDSPEWRLALRIARSALDGTLQIPPEFADVVEYNDPKRSAPRNVCGTKSRLVYQGLAEAGSKHEWYREPANLFEQMLLPKKQDIPECKHKHPKHEAIKPAAPKPRAKFLLAWATHPR